MCGLTAVVWVADHHGVAAHCPGDRLGPLLPFLEALRTLVGVQQERPADGAPAQLTDQQGRGVATDQRMRLATPLRPVPVKSRVVG